MTHVNQSTVRRETGATVTIEDTERILIASLTPEGLRLRPKGMSKSRGVTFPYSSVWTIDPKPEGQQGPEDEDDWDKGYTQGQEDLKDWVARKLNGGGK